MRAASRLAIILLMENISLISSNVVMNHSSFDFLRFSVWTVNEPLVSPPIYYFLQIYNIMKYNIKSRTFLEFKILTIIIT